MTCDEEIVVESIQEILHKVEEKSPASGFRNLTVFRGQRDIEWSVVPSIARQPFPPEAISAAPNNRLSIEDWLLISFRNSSVSMLPPWVTQGTAKEQSWKLLILAQ